MFVMILMYFMKLISALVFFDLYFIQAELIKIFYIGSRLFNCIDLGAHKQQLGAQHKNTRSILYS